MWWADNHPRLKKEKGCIAELEKNMQWLENIEWSFDDQFRMRVVFEIRLDHDIFSLVMTYHETFPSSPPSVAEINQKHLSSHQYNNGDLCLEIRPDNWHQEFTGADMIKSAYSLLTTEAPDSEGNTLTAPSAHNIPETIMNRLYISRFYISAEVDKVLSTDAPDMSTATFWMQWTGASYAIVHLIALEKEKWRWKAEHIPDSLGNDALSRTGILLQTTKNSSDFEKIKTLNDLIDILDRKPELSEEQSMYLIVTQDDNYVLFHKLHGDNKLYRFYPIHAPKQSIRRSGDEFDSIVDKKIGIVGLGSLGSKAAVILARAGVKNFELVDDDILHFDNLERHDADWRDVGVHKVDVVSHRLKLIAPALNIMERRTSIGAQVSTTEAGNVNSALSNCDLVVDATANPKVFNHLSGLITKADKVLVWGGIYAGGIGGYIARSLPKLDPEPLMIREGLNKYYAEIKEPPPVAIHEGYNGQLQDRVLTASDADVSVIAAHLANFAIDALLEQETLQFSEPVYLIGLKRAWIFDSVFDVRPISVDAPIRGALPVHEPDTVEQGFIKKLITEKVNEIENRKKNN